MSKIDDLLAAEAEAAERVDSPENAKGERRNLQRSVMFSVRLNSEELDELKRYAEQRGLPARTLARAWIIDRLHGETTRRDDLGQRVDRLEEAVFRRSA